jgi:hypothetical protein
MQGGGRDSNLAPATSHGAAPLRAPSTRTYALGTNTHSSCAIRLSAIAIVRNRNRRLIVGYPELSESLESQSADVQKEQLDENHLRRSEEPGSLP